MDKIKIKDLEVYANHGVFQEENVLGQKFLVSAVLYTDTRTAGREDDLTKSIHYGETAHQIYRFMKEHTFQLIEAAAEQLARELLLTNPALQKIKLELKKPWAPIGLPVDTVSVEIERSWHTAFIALGSNMGEKELFLTEALKKIEEMQDCIIIEKSSFLITEPYGYTDQEEFLNGAVKIKTLFTPEELLKALQKIEQDAGRERKIRWGPRTLDLDIIFYDNLIFSSDALHIPHIDMHRRDFVLKPISEIDPYFRHPVTQKTIMEMLENITAEEKK